MSDTTNTVVPTAPAPVAPATAATAAPVVVPIQVTLTPEQIQTALQPFLADLAKGVPVVEKVIADVKSGGVAGALKDLPAVEEEAQAIFTDVKAALPTIKAGIATTEFWVVAGVLGSIVGLSAAGHPLPINTDAVIGVVAGIYTAARSLVKKTA